MAIHSLSRALEHVDRLEGRLSKIKEKSEGALQHGLELAEVAGAAVMAGYMNIKMGQGGELTVKGVPADLLAGIALNAGGFMGMGGKYDEHLHNLGNGFIAAYGYRLGTHLAAGTAG